ncbi:Protein ZBED8-like [Oopsacas minuta]|uniref:Protein ZBED8-like n=1 Tax=Oopsacas minuta TaxID=111878 RepID=A0AAV7KAH7_9METZ|nr:Protein ZBED8-like [Oopsacas minuta]
MSEDIKNQVVEQIKQSPIFVLQLDESTDVSSCAQLMIYVRYIHDSNFKEEFLFCQPLDSQTRGIDVFKQRKHLFCKKRSRLEKNLGLFAQMALLLCWEAILGSRHAFDSLSLM